MIKIRINQPLFASQGKNLAVRYFGKKVEELSNSKPEKPSSSTEKTYSDEVAEKVSQVYKKYGNPEKLSSKEDHLKMREDLASAVVEARKKFIEKNMLDQVHVIRRP